MTGSKQSGPWIAPALATATALGYALLALTLFPASLQFAKYPRAAEEYLAHTLPSERLLDFSPFYFYLHVVQGMVLDGEVVVWLQIVASAATVVLLFRLLRRFVPVRLAALGAAVFALTRGVTVYAIVLEPEAFLLLFVVAFLHFAMGDRSRDRLLAGAALALALSIRPNVLPLLLVVPIYERLKGGDWLRASAAIVAPSLLVLAALSVRNGVQAGTFSPLGMNPGFVFYEGNNPLSSGKSAIYPPLVADLRSESNEPDNPHLGYRFVASRSLGRPLTTTEVNSYWRARAVSFIADHPGRFARNVVTKAYTILRGYRFHDLSPAQHFDERLSAARIPSFPFTLLIAMGIAGAILAAREWRRLLLPYALLASQTAVMLLMYVSERQRVVLIPVLVLFAVLGLARFPELRSRSRYALTAVLVIAAILLSLPDDSTRDDRHVWDVYAVRGNLFSRALALRDAGELEAAASASAAAYAAAPWLRDYSRPAGVPYGPDGFDARALAARDDEVASPSELFDRAQLLIHNGRLDEAEDILQRLVEQHAHFDRASHESSDPRFDLARIAARRGDLAGATRLLEEVLADVPGDPFVLADLAAITNNGTYRDQIERYFSPLDAAYLIGTAELELGDASASAANFADVVTRIPEMIRTRIYLAAALGAAGETKDAQEVYVGAMQERPDPVMLEEWILPVFERSARDAPQDSAAVARYREVLREFGYLANQPNGEPR